MPGPAPGIFVFVGPIRASLRHCEERSDEAIQRASGVERVSAAFWIASLRSQ